MKILQVRFKNLNSLIGEWTIDLTHPAFSSDGIFAITGPTGSGKTTLLDAICLALYGRTPRLSRISKNGNEIMSRRTGECFAEVSFETQAGRFRCHWSQRRARKKADGELQAPKHEISRAGSGEIVESGIKGVAGRIEAATGMDFDRFTRSMLLAQGGFAAFLQAAADERAPILEQITGTEIYSRISIRVHERQREEREKLNILQAETAGIALLDPDQESEIEQGLAVKHKEEAALVARSADLDKAVAWLTTIEGLNRELHGLQEEADRLQKDCEAFAPERETLDRALRAASLDGACSTLLAVRKQQADESTALHLGKKTLPELEAAAGKQAEALKLAEQHCLAAKEKVKEAAPLIQRIRSLDQKLADLQKAVSEAEQDCRSEAAKLEANRLAGRTEREKRCAIQKKLDVIKAYLREHARDEWLVSGLAGVEEQLNGLLVRQKDIARKETVQKKAAVALEQTARAFDSARKRCAAKARALEEASQRLQQAKMHLDSLLGQRLLREYRAEKDALLRELAFLAKIAELEDHRARLRDGEPCPLCGAREHPFAAGTLPAPDATEQKIAALTSLISKAEAQETAIKGFEEAELAARGQLVESEAQAAAAANDLKAAENTLAELKEGLESLRMGFGELKQAVAVRLLPLGVTHIPDADVASLLAALNARRERWREQVKNEADSEKSLAHSDSEIKRLDAVVELQSASLSEKRQKLESLQQALSDGHGERRALFGDKSPDVEEHRLNRAIADAGDAEKESRALYQERQQAWNNAKVQVASLESSLGQREPELKQLEGSFAEALEQAGFLDEKVFYEARLSTGQREKLAARLRELDERRIRLKARQQDRETRLAAELARKLSDKSLEELEAQRKEHNEALQELRDRIAGLKHRLRENTAAKERVQARRAAVEAQKNECRRWEQLHELIGSADGKKYRNFAQGLTFQIMIAHANLQLQKMTERYLLVRDKAQPLELNVVDNYQAGEIRSTKNLSGGESFIVSLSLALGLSHMASKNVRVDSLFLDEGFGTLDEESLDTALETLAGLQREGKLIGVISHVPAIRERIGTQIRVLPQPGGRSLISGPGCGGACD